MENLILMADSYKSSHYLQFPEYMDILNFLDYNIT